jgi:hypothetical protein
VFCSLDRSSIFLGPQQRNLPATKPDIGVPGDSLLASAAIEGVLSWTSRRKNRCLMSKQP